MTPAGLEPAIPGSVGRCLIHWATGPDISTWARGLSGSGIGLAALKSIRPRDGSDVYIGNVALGNYIARPTSLQFIYDLPVGIRHERTNDSCGVRTHAFADWCLRPALDHSAKLSQAKVCAASPMAMRHGPLTMRTEKTQTSKIDV